MKSYQWCVRKLNLLKVGWCFWELKLNVILLSQIYFIGDELITYRGCQLDIERSNACQYAQSQLDLIGNSEIKIKTCDLCVNDSCNFSSHTVTDIHLVLVLLAFIILFC